MFMSNSDLLKFAVEFPGCFLFNFLAVMGMFSLL